jgi:hypothetical protein
VINDAEKETGTLETTTKSTIGITIKEPEDDGRLD